MGRIAQVLLSQLFFDTMDASRKVLHGAGNERVSSGHNGEAVSELKAGSETSNATGREQCDD